MGVVELLRQNPKGFHEQIGLRIPLQRLQQVGMTGREDDGMTGRRERRDNGDDETKGTPTNSFT